MAQHDYNIANQSGAAFRQDLNNALSAIVSINSGAAEPSTTFAYQLWADTTAGVLKIRNSANNAWIALRELDGTLLLEGGSAAAPGLYFSGDVNTGIFSPGADQLAIATGGVQRLLIDASGNLTTSGGLTVSSLNGGPLAGARNRLINGSMAVDQRNAGGAQTITAAAALAYSVDRWYAYCTGANVTGQRIQGASVGQFYYRFNGAASITAIGLGQRIEQLNSADLAGTTATLSVDLANTFLTTITWTAFYANTADTFGTLASPTRTQIATGTFTVSSVVTRYSTNISIPAAATTGIEIVFTVGAQTSGTWTIGNVQLEAGTVATPLERRSYGQELALCQRYYCKTFNQSSVPASGGGQAGALISPGNATGITNKAYTVTWYYPAPGGMRISPTITTYNPSVAGSGWYTSTGASVAVNVPNVGTQGVTVTNGVAAPATGENAVIHVTADAEL